MDGVTVVAGSRVLCKNQTDGSQNGVYLASTGLWQRSPDFRNTGDVLEGTQIRVTDGSVGVGVYTVTTADPITIGTTSITFTKDSASLSGAMLTANNGSDIASPIAFLDNLTSNGNTIVASSTLNLDAATGDWIDVSGNTTITAVTLTAGNEREVRFTGTPQITVGASLIGNNGGSNITLAAGDRVTFRGYAAGVVRFWVERLSGQAVANPTGMASLTTQDQVLTGGVIPTSLSLGTISSGTVTPDPGDRPQQHYTNGGAHTLAPSANAGSILLDITNNASAGAITTSGWTKVVGAFTTTNGNKFRCSCSIGNAGSLLTIQALQ